MVRSRRRGRCGRTGGRSGAGTAAACCGPRSGRPGTWSSASRCSVRSARRPGGDWCTGCRRTAARCRRRPAGWLLAAAAVALVGAALRGLAAAGPVSAQPAAVSWILAGPVDRAGVLAPRFWLSAAGATALGAAVGALLPVPTEPALALVLAGDGRRRRGRRPPRSRPLPRPSSRARRASARLVPRWPGRGPGCSSSRRGVGWWSRWRGWPGIRCRRRRPGRCSPWSPSRRRWSSPRSAAGARGPGSAGSTAARWPPAGRSCSA